ncbi:MAG TPA: TonB-dependent receptor [Steroidobacteraceae bacterium]|nr:TonB-dependent receptor [Steroidobacteraceae bacterium]
MKPNHKLSRTIAAILSASAAHAILAADANPTTAAAAAATADSATASSDAAATTSASTNSLQTVIVTAQRRVQNIQDVPITIQAMTGKTLTNLNVQTFADYVKYLPNVSTGSQGPGMGTLFMRGLSTGVLGTQGQGSVGLFPNVAVYLDDQSELLPGRDLDVYAVDLERIEVLEGPQGTLFGAGAQAGVVRFITNKPKLDTFAVDVHGGYGITAGGDPNTNVDATFNFPLLEDKMAARVVVFNDRRGGYINNLPAYFARGSEDLGIADGLGGVVPTNSVVINNDQIAARGINPVTYNGIRGEILYKINDDWSVLFSQMYQNMDAEGVFFEMPNGTEGAGLTNPGGVPIGGQPLPPDSVNLFNPSYDKDKFENSALNVQGKIGPLSLVYAGAYLDRNIDQVMDYTNYARGRYGYYYQCAGYSAGNAAAGACYSPSSVWKDKERDTHVSQELRLSTPDSWRLRGMVGLFYEDYKVYDDTQWMYKSVPDCSPGVLMTNCYLPIQPWQDDPTNNPGVQPQDGFFDDFQRTFIQHAAYTSESFDIIPEKLTITGGIRYFHMYTSEVGGDVGSFYCKIFSPSTLTNYPIVNGAYAPCGTDGLPGKKSPYGTDFAKQNPHTLTQSGMRGRADLEYHVTPDILVYYTYSQGFRPGGFNRGSSDHLPNAAGQDQYATPLTYLSDNLTNNEVGWKTLWFDHRLEVNGAVYQENWSNAQVSFFCPQCGLGNLTYNTNGPDYKVKGVELQIAANLWHGLSVNGAAAWNSGTLENSPSLIGNIAGTTDFGKPLSTFYVNGVATPIQNVYGKQGSPLADSPPFEANLRVRYDWEWNDYLPYVQIGAQHQSHSQSASGNVESYDQPEWTTYDLSAGVAKDDWTVSLIGTNITDANKSLFTTSRQWILTETPMRPRVIELTFGYSFSAHH